MRTSFHLLPTLCFIKDRVQGTEVRIDIKGVVIIYCLILIPGSQNINELSEMQHAVMSFARRNIAATVQDLTAVTSLTKKMWSCS